MKKSKLLKVAIKAARAAGKIILKNYGCATFEFKNDDSLVSNADKASEKKIKQIILKEFPDHGFCGEEFGCTNLSSDHVWFIDPIDGTTNYKIQLPYFNVSIGLVVNNESVVAVVFNPYTKEMFCAEKGKGAELNGKPIRVSRAKTLKGTVLDLGHRKTHKETREAVNIYSDLIKHKLRIRRLGSAALELAYVGAGRLDGCIMHGINSWDIAAGLLIVTESGGSVSDFKGKSATVNTSQLIASNGLVQNDLVKVVKKNVKFKKITSNKLKVKTISKNVRKKK
ncbi:inositol monophosphatase [Candidatus Woesearchaeota archaeon]|jgi:myo-inositol-1(or 4)-monophosphatase|nr:inositol monophosphatase [Candidatus Woesearchaeota archaeon]